MKTILLVVIITTAVMFCGAVIYIRQASKEDTETYQTNNPNQINNPNQPDQTQQETNPNVPLPSPEYTINLFFELINDDRIPEAIKLMSSNLVPDDSITQAYGVQFNEIQSIEAVEITPYDNDNWTSNQKIYKVKIEVKMSPESASAIIPYYGWDTSPIYKWVTVTRSDLNNLWEIDQIASGP